MAASIENDEINGINITPLVDIVLVLLIIFMVSTSFLTKQTIEVDVPTPARGPTDLAQPPLMITIDAHGALFVDGVELTREQAAPKLRDAWKQNHDARAVITADKTRDYAEVVSLIDLVRGTGITHFMMAK